MADETVVFPASPLADYFQGIEAGTTMGVDVSEQREEPEVDPSEEYGDDEQAEKKTGFDAYARASKWIDWSKEMAAACWTTLHPSINQCHATHESIWKTHISTFLIQQIQGTRDLQRTLEPRHFFHSRKKVEVGRLLVAGLWGLWARSAVLVLRMLARRGRLGRGGVVLGMLTLGSGVPLVAVTRRQMLYSRIAYVYSTANATLQSHVKAMQTFDTLFRKTVRQVQDLQLVSRGYRLGSERRVESDVEHRRCGWLREMLAESLLGISDLAVSSYGQLLAVAGVSAPGTNNNNNSNIGGGAGPTPLILELPDPSIALAVESPTTPPLPDSQLQHQQPQTTHTLTRAHMHIKSQRIQILDALVLSSSFTGSPSTLSRRWNQINAIVRRLTRLYEGQTGLLLECADASLSVGRYKSSRTSDTRDTRHSSHDPPALQSLKHQTINSLASLDDILREMRAKILLCAQDLRDTSSISELTAKCSVLQSQFPHDVERLTSAFSTLQSTFQQSPTLAIDAPPPPLPPQRQIGDMYTHLEGVRDCAEDTTLLTVAGVFEDISGPTTEKPIPRSDRIKARNEKRVGDVKRKQDKMARDSVIVELRNVLDLRRVV